MNGPQPDRASAAEFLDFLHADHEGWVCLATEAHGEPWREDFYRWPDERETLLDDAMGRALRADVYVSMLLHSGRMRRKDSALPGRAAWADVDHDLTAEHEAKVARLPHRVVHSGTPGHLHFYVDLGERIDPARLVAMNEHLARVLDGDHCHDAARVLRLPGTFNHKGGELRPVESVAHVGQ